MILVWITFLSILIYASITDIKEGTIRPLSFLVGSVVSTIYLVCFLHRFDFFSSIIASLIIGVLFYIGTYYGGGGGDVIMMMSLGWIFGVNISLYICLFSTFEYLLGLVFIAIRNKTSLKSLTLPFAPFVLSGFITTFLYFFLVNPSFLS